MIEDSCLLCVPFFRILFNIWKYVFVAVVVCYRVYKSKYRIILLCSPYRSKKTFHLRLSPNYMFYRRFDSSSFLHVPKREAALQDQILTPFFQSVRNCRSKVTSDMERWSVNFKKQNNVYGFSISAVANRKNSTWDKLPTR
jgi:hypothetical protein